MLIEQDWYKIKYSSRARKIRIEIKKNGDVFLVVPKNIPVFIAKLFLFSKRQWIIKKQNEIKKKKIRKIPELSQEDFLKYKDIAYQKILERVEYFSKKGNFDYGKISIKNNKTNWGSCSSKKNLNFNYRIIFLSKKEIDYIVVHELSHLKEMNHSKKFWKEVEKYCPDYKKIRKELKNVG